MYFKSLTDNLILKLSAAFLMSVHQYTALLQTIYAVLDNLAYLFFFNNHGLIYILLPSFLYRLSMNLWIVGDPAHISDVTHL